MMSAGNWHAFLAILHLAFSHTLASSQREPQEAKTLLQVAGTEDSEYVTGASLAFPDIPDSADIDVGQSSVTFPDVSQSNSFYPKLSSSELGRNRNDADVGVPPATRGSFLQLPPPANFLHLQPLHQLDLPQPRGQVRDRAKLSQPLPSLRISTTLAKLAASAAPSAQSFDSHHEGQRKRSEMELLSGMQQELTKLSREVETLADRSATSPARIGSGLHFIGSTGGDRHTSDERRAGKSIAPGISASEDTTAAADAIGDATVYSKIGMIVPVAFQIVVVMMVVHCAWAHLHTRFFHDHYILCPAVFVFLIIADIIWVCICLTGIMDAHVKQGVAVSICALLIIGNVAIVGVLLFAMVRKTKLGQALARIPDDLVVVKNVVHGLEEKIERMTHQFADGAENAKHLLLPDFDSSDEKDYDPATSASGEAIRISIREAKKLPETNNHFPFFFGGSNAYCSCAVQGRPEFQCKTQTVLGTVDPVWHYRHLFKYLRHADVLMFRVWDLKERLGEYNASLRDLQDPLKVPRITEGPLKGWIELHLKDVKGQPTGSTLYVRIDIATAENLETASKLNGTGL